MTAVTDCRYTYSYWIDGWSNKEMVLYVSQIFCHSELDYSYLLPSRNCSKILLNRMPCLIGHNVIFLFWKHWRLGKAETAINSSVFFQINLWTPQCNCNCVAPSKVNFFIYFISKNTFKPRCSDIGKKENVLSHLAKLRVFIPCGISAFWMTSDGANGRCQT